MRRTIRGEVAGEASVRSPGRDRLGGPGVVEGSQDRWADTGRVASGWGAGLFLCASDSRESFLKRTERNSVSPYTGLGVVDKRPAASQGLVQGSLNFLNRRPVHSLRPFTVKL